MMTLSINLKKFVLFDTIKIYKGVNIIRELQKWHMCFISHWRVWALIISHDLLNPIGATIIIASIFKREH